MTQAATNASPTTPGVEYRFGAFRLVLPARLLWEQDRLVRLGGRAFDILLFLVERAGEVVARRDLMDHVWPGALVVDANLTVHIATLRRALGEDAIHNVPGRGYIFVAAVTRALAATASPTMALSTAPHNLPLQPTRLVGRDVVVELLVDRLSSERVLTLVGAGGIGKTSVALAVAERMLARRKAGVWLLDLAPIADPKLLPSALAAAMGLAHPPSDPMGAILRSLPGQDVLVVIDNCEHMLEATADLVSGLQGASSQLSVLATSREALLAPGEAVHRLEPLETPPVNARDAQSVLAYPAARLFVERARAEADDFKLDDSEAPALGRICRELDGLPLAIEFAAARVATLGLAGVAGRLDDRLRLLSLGARDGDPRHRTIAAALEWSYGLLSNAERAVLDRLSVFSGGFTLEAARTVLGEDAVDPIAALVLKSLVTAEAGEREVRFRLLETTRAFAMARLEESGGKAVPARAHAAYFGGLLEAAAQDPARFERLAAEVDNVRAALGWTLRGEPDLERRLMLVAASSAFWFVRSLHLECRDWMERAIATVPEGVAPGRAELAVRFALAASAFFTRGIAAEDYALWLRALDVATRLGASDYQLDALVALWTYNIRFPRYQEAVAFAQRHGQLASEARDAGGQVTNDWMWGTTHNHMGQHAKARVHLGRFVAEESEPARLLWIQRTGFDRRSDARGLLALTNALEGSHARADEMFATSILEARSTGKALPICEALQWAAVGAMVAGAPAGGLAEWGVELREAALRHGLESHVAMGACVLGKVAAIEGDLEGAGRLIGEGLSGLKAANYGPFNGFFVGELARVMAGLGRLEDAISLVAAYEADATGGEGFLDAAFLRRKAQVLWLAGRGEAARGALGAAIDLARRQEARGLLLGAIDLAVELASSAQQRSRLRAELGVLVDAMATERSPRLLRARRRLAVSEA